MQMRHTPRGNCTAHCNPCLIISQVASTNRKLLHYVKTRIVNFHCLSLSLTKVKRILTARLRTSWMWRQAIWKNRNNDWHCNPHRTLTFLWKCISTLSQPPTLDRGGWISITAQSPWIHPPVLIREDLIDRRAGLEAVAIRKNSRPLRE